VRRLDALLVSHLDQDHAGGEGSVLRAYPEALRFSSDPLPGEPTRNCRERYTGR
jgi:beta-lactamase superfamily II metal-dependent hydrolase